MSESRSRIMERLRKAEKGTAADKAGARETMLRQLNEVSPRNAEECFTVFSRELAAADGEVIRVNDLSEAAVRIAELNSGKLIVSAEQECEQVADELADRFRRDVVKITSIPEDERKKVISEIPAAVVKAGYGIADIGSVVFLYDDTKTTCPHFLAETVFVLLSAETIAAHQFELLEWIPEEKTGNMVFVTGPSRTADIEKVLILGAHGPKRVVVIVYP